ncbi:hypothetical protein [Salinisphaera sp. T31B1]
MTGRRRMDCIQRDPLYAVVWVGVMFLCIAFWGFAMAIVLWLIRAMT